MNDILEGTYETSVHVVELAVVLVAANIRAIEMYSDCSKIRMELDRIDRAVVEKVPCKELPEIRIGRFLE